MVPPKYLYYGMTQKAKYSKEDHLQDVLQWILTLVAIIMQGDAHRQYQE